MNTSRAFTVMVREYINNRSGGGAAGRDRAAGAAPAGGAPPRGLAAGHDHRAAEIPTVGTQCEQRQGGAEDPGTEYRPERFDELKPYLSAEDHAYVLGKGNRSSHLLSLQTRQLMVLRQQGLIEHFRHLQLQTQITEMYTLQGKSRRIKNFPSRASTPPSTTSSWCCS